MNLNSKLTLSLALVALLGSSCKKQAQLTAPSNEITQNAETSAMHPQREDYLFTITENTGFAVLDVVEHHDKIFIKNRRPGYGLSYGNGQYFIQDKHGKTFTFSSRTAFAEFSETGLMDKIKIFKDGKEIFSNRRHH